VPPALLFRRPAILKRGNLCPTGVATLRHITGLRGCRRCTSNQKHAAKNYCCQCPLATSHGCFAPLL
jgi:hypothetical protein